MSKLRPTLWRTCRVIACETRLQLLWALFREGELCVSGSAKYVGMGAAQASIQLRALNARGLISSRREKMNVFYRPEANESVDFSPQILSGLRQSYERRMAHRTVVHQATAFTHQRRIEMVQVLAGARMGLDELSWETGMPVSSIYLHLGKLEARGMIEETEGCYGLTRPKNRFGALLLRIILS